MSIDRRRACVRDEIIEKIHYLEDLPRLTLGQRFDLRVCKWIIRRGIA